MAPCTKVGGKIVWPVAKVDFCILKVIFILGNGKVIWLMGKGSIYGRMAQHMKANGYIMSNKERA